MDDLFRRSLSAALGDGGEQSSDNVRVWNAAEGNVDLAQFQFTLICDWGERETLDLGTH